MSRGQPTKAVGPTEARAYHGVAAEFLHAAQESLVASNYHAAVSNAVHAGIAAADAIAAFRTGAVWQGAHDQAARHLEQAGTEGRQGSPHLRRLLPLKNQAEYDPAPIPKRKAEGALRAAQQLMTIAGRLIGSETPSE
jgi:hypothetical protein